jgi:putative transposase
MPRETIISTVRRRRTPAITRHGYVGKTALTDTGKLKLAIPARWPLQPGADGQIPAALRGFDDKIIALYARGLITREIAEHVGELYD